MVAFLGYWAISAMISTPYFWVKKVDRSLSPLARRLIAFGYGLGWPYFVVKYFVDKKKEQTRSPEMDQRRQRILGDGPTHGSAPASGEGPVGKIRDPFEMG